MSAYKSVYVNVSSITFDENSTLPIIVLMIAKMT